MVNSPEHVQVDIVGMNGGDEESADVTFEYNHRRITLSLFASPNRTKENLEDRMIRIVNDAILSDGEEYDAITDQIYDIILDVGRIPFSQLAPLSTTAPSQDLHSLLYPETLDYRLQTIDGKATIFPIDPKESVSVPNTGPNPGVVTEFQATKTIPRYSSRDVQVQEVLVSGYGTVCKALVGSQAMLCKAHNQGLENSSLERELDAMHKIRNACSDPSVNIRVPHFRGYATFADSGDIIGLLHDWVLPSSYGSTLRDMDISAVPRELKKRWLDQIRQTVDKLHEIGVVWGDGKASNVVVDQEDNIWLINFAGGWTEGWVDEELANSMDGDDQAVKNITRFLGVEE
ncbi:Protein kinase domain-containing protein [Fusarium sp. LHS14.1]|nr:Protein kinase domain-containing protein [Fusarium sp. LHS14.1]